MRLASFIHRDIKPENFVMRFREDKHVCLIAFNLSAKYENKKGHYIEKRIVEPTRNYCYLSINAHGRIVQTRRDDMEALA